MTGADPTADVVAALTGPGAVVVRRRVLAQLVSSLLYEGVLHAEPEIGPELGEHIVRTIRTDGTVEATHTVVAHRAHGFARVRLGAPVMRTAGGVTREVTSLPRFVAEALGDEPDLRRFAGELVATLVNDALAEHARRGRPDVLADADHDALEGLVTDGHRYHPTYKSRIGFDVADDLAFGPEFRPVLHPLWLAADPALAGTVASSVVVPDLPDAPAGFHAVPVHPWQWRSTVVTAFASELADGRLVVLGPDRHAFTPQQSIRTLACRDDVSRATLKTALSITNTSTVRTLAPHTVRNAAPISDWLRALVAGDPELAGRVVVLGETRGTTVRPGHGPEGVLGAIWREPLAPHLRPGEQAVPATALTARERDGTPVVAGWIAAHGAETWVRAWVDAVAAPLVAVLVRHGVALESHTQNVSVVLSGGLPVRVVVRDFHDGVRFCRALLADPAGAPVLEAPPAHHTNRNSFLETDDPAQVTDFLLDAFFFVHAGELGLFLHEHGLLDEHRFWALVAAALPPAGAGPFDLTAPTVQVERLTSRRLGADTELALHAVPNPLANRSAR